METLKSCPFEEPVGKYKIEIDKPKTNEDWFCQLPTEEKAKWLNQQMMYAAREQGYFTVDGLIKWLRQPHKPIS